MELNATAKVILGLIAARPRSGYEVKQIVDHSARFFWAASYGQIYPELKKLEKAGLIAGEDSPQGARQRTVYELTAEGRRVAAEWMARPPEVFETRDEGLLKLFLAGTFDPARTPEIARERAAHAREVGERLAEIERLVKAGMPDGGPGASPDAGSLTALRFGIEHSAWLADWFERAAMRLESELAGAKGTPGRNRRT
ncbi:MAG: PadR family transcriptional regulator [Solirubrobacterales bacterium]